MREPGFWSSPRDVRSLALAPLGWLYGKATAVRLARGARERLNIPVICVGNLNAGGTGKTPTVIALVQRLRDLGHDPHVVSRGYGGSLTGPVAVDPARHKATEVGDEPLLLSAFADVWVAKDRAAGGRAAQTAGASIIVLDDGFQNPALHQDLAFVVVDAARGFGNGRCLPAGPLREPVNVGLGRADALISIGGPADQDRFEACAANRFRAELKPLQTGMDWAGQPFLAFAGIAHPDKFFATLRSLGANLIRTVALDDHEPLTPALMGRLERDAAAVGAQLVTTEKDAARLPASSRGRVLTLPVRLAFDDPDGLDAMLSRLPRAN